MQSKKVIIQKLATKYNLPLKTVTNIINAQFKFVSKTIKEGNFKSVRLPYFGKFDVNEHRLKHIQKKNGSINNK
jgi:nucleoid DNA-binding protein